MTVLEAEGYQAIKADYKVNRTYAFSHLKRCLPSWLLGLVPSTEQFVNTLRELLKNLIAVIPECSKPRPKHPQNTPNLTENMPINQLVELMLGLSFEDCLVPEQLNKSFSSH